MFEWERQRLDRNQIVAAESQQLTLEQRQRDIFETHRHRVFSLSYYMTANELEAEEMLTGTFLQAFHTTKEPDAEAVDRALLHEVEQRFILASTPYATPDNTIELNRGQSKRTEMEEAVAELPPRERLMFLLKDVEGYPASKIANLLGSDENEVQRVVFSARVRMRNVIARIRRERQEQDMDEDERTDPAA